MTDTVAAVIIVTLASIIAPGIVFYTMALGAAVVEGIQQIQRSR